MNKLWQIVSAGRDDCRDRHRWALRDRSWSPWVGVLLLVQALFAQAAPPGAPTIGTATAGDTQASVSFTAPASDGGSPITGYTVTANPGGATGTGASSPLVVTGLTNGVAYTFTVTATNLDGTGASSAASNSVTPASPQTITFANPGAQNFGTSPDLSILGGGASATSGLPVTFTSSTTGVCTITSGGVLTFVTAGTCTINADQAGNSSFLPATQVTRSFTVNAVVPGAPTIGTATAGDTQVSVAFAAPVNTGGSSITGYTVSVNPPDVAPVNGASSPIVVTGLTNGQAYTFTVTADNVAGTGPASAASNSVTPKATQTITFANPGAQNFGTSPTLTATSDSGLTPTFTSSTTGVCTITGGGALSFVTAGICTINADQAGDASYLPATQVSRAFTVNAVVPGAPLAVSAAAGNAQATVSFAAPVSNGGSPITGYTVIASPGGATRTGTASPITFAGLVNGTPYTFTVTASNAVGTGAASAASNSVTPTAGLAGAGGTTLNDANGNVYATESLNANSPTVLGAVLGVAQLGTGVSANDQLFVRLDLSGGVKTVNAPVFAGVPGAWSSITIAQGGVNSAHTIFSLTAAANTSLSDGATIDPGTLSVPGANASATATVCTFETLSDAVNRTAALGCDTHATYLSFATGVAASAQNNELVASVELDYRRFAGSTLLGWLGTHTVDTAPGVLDAQTGAQVAFANIVDAASSLVVYAGDFSLGDYFIDTVSSACGTKSVELIERVGNVIQTSVSASLAAANGGTLCVSEPGTTAIPAADYTVAVDLKGVAGKLAPADLPPKPSGAIVRDGTQIAVAYLTTAPGSNQRLVMTNRGSRDFSYAASFLTESGVIATPGGAATGTLKAGQVTIVRVADMVSFTGGTRGSAVITIPAVAGTVGAAITQVNLGDGGTDTVILD